VYGTDKRSKSFIELRTKLRAFVEYNPLFGRKIYKNEKRFVQVKCSETNNMKTLIKTIRPHSFNLNHMNFYRNNISNVINHLINTQYNISLMRFNSPVREEYYENNYHYANNHEDNDANEEEENEEEENGEEENGEDDDDNEHHINVEIIAVDNLPEEDEASDTISETSRDSIS